MKSSKIPTYGLFINGAWRLKQETFEVVNKYSQDVIANVSYAEKQDVEDAVAAAKNALSKPFAPYQRYTILKKVAEELIARKEEIANILVEEVGKPITESLGEVERAAMTLEISAEEAKRIHRERDSCGSRSWV